VSPCEDSKCSTESYSALSTTSGIEEKTQKLARWLLNPGEQGKLIVAEITWKRAGNG